jgi:hypothetical protein
MTVSYNNVYLEEHWNRQRFNEAMVYCPKEKETTSLLIDTNSVMRNTASAVKSVSPLPIAAGCFISSSSVIGGVLGVPIGLCVARDGFVKGKAALSCGDAEGVATNALWGTVGAAYAGISGLLAADGILSLQGSALPASLTPLFGGLGLAMNGGLLAYGAYGLKQTSQFNKEMKAVLEREGERGVLNWLNGQVTLTRGEVADIRRTAKDPEKEIANLLQKKWNAFEFRTSAAVANLVREKLPGLLEKFDLVKAIALIEAVEKANFMGRVKHINFLVIAVISIVAFICLLVVSGPASPILFAIGAAAWLAVDSSKLHKYIGEKCWNWHRRDTCPTPQLLA